jgi:hypothetical protein
VILRNATVAVIPAGAYIRAAVAKKFAAAWIFEQEIRPFAEKW